MKAILSTGKYPDHQDHIHLDLTPVDYVASGIVAISLKKKRAYPVYHFTQKYIEFGDLVKYFKALGYPLKEIGWKDWLKEITEAVDHPLFPLLHYFKGGFLPNFPSAISFTYMSSLNSLIRPEAIPDTFTRSELGSDVTCPTIDQQVVEAYALFLLGK